MTPEQASSLLQNLLCNEIALHEQYLGVLAEERDAVTNFNADNVTKLSSRRESLRAAMVDAHERRLALVQSFPGGESLKLSEFIVKYCRPADAKVLAPRAAKLKALVKRARSEGAEFQQVADFGLKIVGGTLSILWSATQDVTQSYSKQGRLKEFYHPTSDRPGTARRV